MALLNFTLYKNRTAEKNITENTCLDNWSKYRESLKTFQKNINIYMSSLVEIDNFEAITINLEDEDDSDSSEDNDKKSPKRIKHFPPEIKKKIQKT